MKRNNNIYKVYAFAVAAVLALSSCNDFLDKLPDDRAELDTPEKITNILVSAYPTVSTNVLLEVSSDNVTDNGAAYGASYLFEQIYKFEDISEEGSDSPRSVWNGLYEAVAVANQALQGMENIDPEEVKAQMAEAKLCRAYSMFKLAEVFCMSWDPAKADQYLGLTYPKVPERDLFAHYDRGTLAELYANIDKDIEEALPNVDDNLYKQPVYHFNKKAAYAFAARFNLYYQKFDKAIKYASEVLGSDPKAVMRNYDNYIDLGRVDIGNLWIRSSEQGNIMLMTSYSLAGRNLSGGSEARFHHNATVCSYETFWPDGPWGSGSDDNTLYYTHKLYGNNQAVSFPKMDEQFEFTDKVNQIGYPHIVDAVFTGDETLLVRAEAYALTKQYDLALADLQTWIDTHCYEKYEHVDEKTGAKSYTDRPVLSLEMNNAFWNSMDYAPAVPDGNRDRSIRKQLNPIGFTLEPGETVIDKDGDEDYLASTQENLIQMVLHMRRMEMIFQGMRFFDIKRYGIPFSHPVSGHDPVEFKPGDLRGALQLPLDVIQAGLEPNPRDPATNNSNE